MARRRALTPGDSPADSEHQSATAIIGRHWDCQCQWQPERAVASLSVRLTNTAARLGTFTEAAGRGACQQ